MQEAHQEGKFDPPEGRNARRFVDHLSEGQDARRFFDGAFVGSESTTKCTITGLDEQKSGVSRLYFARPPEDRLRAFPHAELAGRIPQSSILRMNARKNFDGLENGLSRICC